MIISVASGKGGTGKTTIATNLAAVIKNSTYVDCDVEEPNGAIILKPDFDYTKSVYKKLPKIDIFKCTYCGKCKTVCEFNAIVFILGEVLVVDEMCHSCGACSYFCPENAISEIVKEIGKINIGRAGEINFIEGVLNIGEASASPLIKELIKTKINDGVTIIDSPPGTSCSMVEAVKNSDYCILVTESTPFGLHDLKLAIKAVRNLGINFGVIINKCDPMYKELDEYLASEKIEILTKIPFEKKYAELYSSGELLIKDTIFRGKMKSVYLNIENKFKDIK